MEEVHNPAVSDCAVFDLVLTHKVGDGCDGAADLFDGQEGGQVGGVGRDEDEGEEPPGARDDATRQGHRGRLRAALHQTAEHEPTALSEIKPSGRKKEYVLI